MFVQFMLMSVACFLYFLSSEIRFVWGQSDVITEDLSAGRKGVEIIWK
jgi:hypothetical protein